MPFWTPTLDATKRVLLLDQDERGGPVLHRFLAAYYTCSFARDIEQAAAILEREPHFNLLLLGCNPNDLNTVQQVGLLIQRQKSAPAALLCDTDFEHLIETLGTMGIHNVVCRSMPVPFSQILRQVDSLIHPQRAFGLRRYLRAGTQVEEYPVRSRDERDKANEAITAFFERHRAISTDAMQLRLAFEEILNNALFHAFKNAQGGDKYFPASFKSLDPEDEVRVQFGIDEDHLGFSISDSAGLLTPELVLKKLARQVSMAGLYDENGRGLFLCRSFSDHMVVAVKPDTMTQILVLANNASHHRSGPKPLSIHLVPGGRATEFQPFSSSGIMHRLPASLA